MRISTKGRFAVNAMLDLALREAAGPVALATIGQRQGISLSYLEQLFGGLRAAGLVQASRGPGGGYRLARAAAAISIADIVLAVDEQAPVVDHRPGAPATAPLWEQIEQTMRRHMAAISLQSLMDQQHERGEPIFVAPRRRSLAARVATSPARSLRALPPNSVFALGHALAGVPPSR
ncbi:MAG: Rrf2 family transcriptional regulator [Rubrivivax sp.]